MTRFRTAHRKLHPHHGWRAQPDHKILVLDRGAVRLEIPRRWHVAPGADCVKLHDRRPPADQCTLAVSYHLWPPIARDLGVGMLVRAAMEAAGAPQDPQAPGERAAPGGAGRAFSFSELTPVVEETRMDLVLAWCEGRHLDGRERRPACSRLCLARREEIQALLTFDFWAADLARCDALWHGFLATLQLGEWIEDPLRGPALA